LESSTVFPSSVFTTLEGGSVTKKDIVES
jgi:hypothetical protein